jgi:hypothetical protein
MGYQYGAGINAVSTNGEGYMSDANSYGLRLDYALAANLNMYFTGFYADRASNGWPVGVMTQLQTQRQLSVPVSPATSHGAGPPLGGNVAMINFSKGGANAFLMGQGLPGVSTVPANVQNVGGNGSAPNIPDNSLGWEIGAGCEWKLLEGLKTTFRGSYWQPGAWFKWACIDRGAANVPSTVSPVNPPLPQVEGVYISPVAGTGAYGWGVNPAKTIDPIVMFQSTMQVDF